MNCWPEGVLGLRNINDHVLEDLEDFILLQGFKNMGNAEVKKRIEDNTLERRQRQHMMLLEAAKEANTEEYKEGTVRNPVKEGELEDKKRSFMQPLRPHEKIWNFEIDEEEEKVDHVMRVGADPRKCYIDGRVEKLIERIEKIGVHLTQQNPEMWKYLETHVLDIFYDQEKELNASMKNYLASNGDKN